jgi:hypothetical protein
MLSWEYFIAILTSQIVFFIALGIVLEQCVVILDGCVLLNIY